MFRTSSKLYHQSLPKLIKHINTNRPLNRSSLIPRLKAYNGQDWKKYSNTYLDTFVWKNNQYSIIIRRYPLVQSHNPFLKKVSPIVHTNTIFKVLDGEFQVSSVTDVERVYPLGMNDVFLSSALYNIRNVTDGTLLEIRFEEH